MAAVEQVCLRHAVDRERIVVAGLSAGASMAALLVTRYPGHLKGLVMLSKIPPRAAHSALTAMLAMRGWRIPSSMLPSPAVQAAPSLTAASRAPLLLIHGAAERVVNVSNTRPRWAAVLAT